MRYVFGQKSIPTSVLDPSQIGKSFFMQSSNQNLFPILWIVLEGFFLIESIVQQQTIRGRPYKSSAQNREQLTFCSQNVRTGSTFSPLSADVFYGRSLFVIFKFEKIKILGKQVIL